MDKKGFATSTIIYSLLALFLISLSILLITMNNTASLNKTLNEKTIENIEYGASSLNDLEARITELENKMLNIDDIYPVGSVYISTEDDTVEKVKNRFGGEWEKYSEGRTLVGEGTSTDSNGNVKTYLSNETGGNSLVKLSQSNLPNHSHTYTPSGSISSTFTGATVFTSFDGTHNHTVYGVRGENTTTSVYLQLQVDGNFVLYSSTGAALWNSGTKFNNGSSYRYTSIGIDGATSSAANHRHAVTSAGTVKSTFTGTSSNTTSCTNCSGTSFSVENPYIVTYMYKRVK